MELEVFYFYKLERVCLFFHVNNEKNKKIFINTVHSRWVQLSLVVLFLVEFQPKFHMSFRAQSLHLRNSYLIDYVCHLIIYPSVFIPKPEIPQLGYAFNRKYNSRIIPCVTVLLDGTAQDSTTYYQTGFHGSWQLPEDFFTMRS